LLVVDRRAAARRRGMVKRARALCRTSARCPWCC